MLSRRTLMAVAAMALLVALGVACTDDSSGSSSLLVVPCPAAAHPWQLRPQSSDESGDGLPQSGTATRAAATEVLRHDRETLLAKYGASDALVVVERGRAWVEAGHIVGEDIATIVLSIRSADGCADKPSFWNGIPISFQVIS